MCHENMQVEFEFGSGRIIFGRVMPLGLKIPLIFSFRSFSPLQIDIEIGSGRIIFGTVMPLALRKIPIMSHKNTQIKFRYGSI